MDAEISKPKESKKSNHPIIKNLSVSIEQRGKFIGPGGVNLKRISQKTGVTISSNDDLNFTLFAPNRNALEEAEDMIKIILNFQVINYLMQIIQLNYQMNKLNFSL